MVHLELGVGPDTAVMGSRAQQIGAAQQRLMQSALGQALAAAEAHGLAQVSYGEAADLDDGFVFVINGNAVATAPLDAGDDPGTLEVFFREAGLSHPTSFGRGGHDAVGAGGHAGVTHVVIHLGPDPRVAGGLDAQVQHAHAVVSQSRLGRILAALEGEGRASVTYQPMPDLPGQFVFECDGRQVASAGLLDGDDTGTVQVLLREAGLALPGSVGADDAPTSYDGGVPDEIIAAVHRLNAIRANPGAYSHEVGVDLSYVPPRHPLQWSPLLAQVALERVRDMIERNYAGHTDPDGVGTNVKLLRAGYPLSPNYGQPVNANSFESYTCGPMSPVEAIHDLIVDAGYDDPGHRKHLLGMEHAAGYREIGMAFSLARGVEYPSYCIVLIAAPDP